MEISTDPEPSWSNMYIEGTRAIADARTTASTRLDGVISGRRSLRLGLRTTGIRTIAIETAIRTNPSTMLLRRMEIENSRSAMLAASHGPYPDATDLDSSSVMRLQSTPMLRYLYHPPCSHMYSPQHTIG